MAELFGFEFKKVGKEKEPQSFVPPRDDDDGAVVVSAGGAYGTYVDLDGTVRSEAELVTKYRDMSLQPECDSAIDEIVNESIAIDAETIIDINIDDLDATASIKKAIKDEFQNCLKIIEFNRYAYEIYRRWYIDGRLYYHVVIDETKPKEGIKEIRFIDPRKIRKVREVQKTKAKAGNVVDTPITRVVNEYYVFNDKGFLTGGVGGGKNMTMNSAVSGLKIAKDSIIQVVSGLTDTNGSMVLSYLHKGIKALNQLRTLEDALVIYRLARAPERRVWYIDVGNLPKMKAEQYVRDIMVKHKNRLIYDAQTGDIRDDRKFMTMLEDYWLPRREGGRGTEVTTLAGGQNLSQMDDVVYFQKKFLQTLNVPVSRLNNDSVYTIGRATEITRDEIKFARYITRLRSRFSMLFYRMLEKQLILKGIITPEDWKVMSSQIRFDFSHDNYFSELKEAEITQARLSLARDYQDMTEKYVSHEWVRRQILRQTDEDIVEQDAQIARESQSGEARWINPMIQQNAQAAQPPDDGSQQGGDQAPEDESTNQKKQDVINAMTYIKQMKEKGVNNRSMQEQSKYKAAVQIVAKNPDIAKQISAQQT